jgi:hypothetical protein
MEPLPKQVDLDAAGGRKWLDRKLVFARFGEPDD